MRFKGKLILKIVLTLFIAISQSRSQENVQNSMVLFSDSVFSPGDAIRITASADTGSFINGDYTISMDGTAFLPIIGQVNVTKMSTAEFSTLLRNAYQPYLRYPELQVQPLIRVCVLGGFTQPGMYYLEPNKSIWDILYISGGLKFSDGLKQLRWERNNKVINKNLAPLVESGQSLRQIGFKSGDQLRVREKPPQDFWDRVIGDYLVRGLIPISTFALSLLLTYESLTDDNN